MLTRVLAMLIGYALACLAAGAAKTWAILRDAEVSVLANDVVGGLTGDAGLLAVGSALHIAQFAAPFALVAFGISEWRGIRSWLYYLAVGLLIAVLGLAALIVSETGSGTLFNERAVFAFLAAGLLGGFVYWLVTGRRAGGRAVDLTLAKTADVPAKPASPEPPRKVAEVVAAKVKEAGVVANKPATPPAPKKS